jgi:hypothetical protein
MVLHKPFSLGPQLGVSFLRSRAWTGSSQGDPLSWEYTPDLHAAKHDTLDQRWKEISSSMSKAILFGQSRSSSKETPERLTQKPCLPAFHPSCKRALAHALAGPVAQADGLLTTRSQQPENRRNIRPAGRSRFHNEEVHMLIGRRRALKVGSTSGPAKHRSTVQERDLAF